MAFHLSDFPRVFRPFFKLTKDSKTPTDLELDELKNQLAFYFPPVWELFKKILKEEFVRFIKYRWKRLVGLIIITTSIITVSYFAVKYFIEPIIIHKTETVIPEIVYIQKLRPFNDFLVAVAHREASGTYDTISLGGMLGAFQFSNTTLKAIGISVSKEDFLNNEELQIGAFKQLLLSNYRTYEKYALKWNNRQIKNVRGTVTTSGVLMAFHLKPTDAKAFFDSNGNDLGGGDGNGTKVNHYIELFSGYELPF